MFALIDATARRFAMWLVWNVPLGPAAPYVLGFAIGASFRVEDRQ